MLSNESFEDFLQRNIDKDLLRIVACGSVDDGKSTLLGRLLHDASKVYEDQLASVRADSKRYGTTGEEPDLALLLDGLQAEREQGITIDVAYRYFSTDKRKFIVADAPGHEQYTRNMATGASNAELAVILIDARNGVQRQTRRHSYIVSALGIRSAVVAINKMDLVGYDYKVFERIQTDYAQLSSDLGLTQVHYIPLSALKGDNVVLESVNMDWYTGPPLLRYLEDVVVPSTANRAGLRLPIQLVSRPHQDFRGYCGTVAAGSLCPGQAVKVLPAGTTTKINALYDGGGEIESAGTGEAVMVTLTDKVDVSRGCLLVGSEEEVEVTDAAIARIVWMSERPLRPGDLYDFKVGVQYCPASVEAILSEIDMDRNLHAQAEELRLNDIGIVKLQFQSRVAIEAYSTCPETGSFIIVDRLTNMTVGAGMIMADGEAPVGADRPDVFWHQQSLTKLDRSKAKKQKPCIVWFTGLSGAGKSTIANALEKRLHSLGYHTYLLDGDNLRYGLNKDLGFSHEDRTENIRRVGEVAKLMVDAGLIVLCAFVSPYRKDRDAIRESLEKNEFVEVYVSTPIEVCEERDTKGLYRKARLGEIDAFTGVSATYEAPVHPDIQIDASSLTVDECSHRLLNIVTTDKTRGFNDGGPARDT